MPTFSLGTPDIPDEVYDRVKKLWDDECADKEANSYRNRALKKKIKKDEE